MQPSIIRIFAYIYDCHSWFEFFFVIANLANLSFVITPSFYCIALHKGSRSKRLEWIQGIVALLSRIQSIKYYIEILWTHIKCFWAYIYIYINMHYIFCSYNAKCTLRLIINSKSCWNNNVNLLVITGVNTYKE